MSITVVLDRAQLEAVPGRGGDKKQVLLSGETAPEHMREKGVKLKEARPDIVHQCLMALLDSPLNREGRLKILVRSTQNVIIEVHPRLRVPRMFSRFSGLIVQLLNRHKIVAAEGGEREPLMKLVKGPLDKHLDKGAVRIGLSREGERVTREMFREAEGGIVFFINAVSEGEDRFDNVDKTVSLSPYALSASTCCAKVCYLMEDILLGIFT